MRSKSRGVNILVAAKDGLLVIAAEPADEQVETGDAVSTEVVGTSEEAEISGLGDKLSEVIAAALVCIQRKDRGSVFEITMEKIVLNHSK